MAKSDKELINDDIRHFGTAITRQHADGRVERIDPKDIRGPHPFQDHLAWQMCPICKEMANEQTTLNNLEDDPNSASGKRIKR